MIRIIIIYSNFRMNVTVHQKRGETRERRLLVYRPHSLSNYEGRISKTYQLKILSEVKPHAPQLWTGDDSMPSVTALLYFPNHPLSWPWSLGCGFTFGPGALSGEESLSQSTFNPWDWTETISSSQFLARKTSFPSTSPASSTAVLFAIGVPVRAILVSWSNIWSVWPSSWTLHHRFVQYMSLPSNMSCRNTITRYCFFFTVFLSCQIHSKSVILDCATRLGNLVAMSSPGCIYLRSAEHLDPTPRRFFDGGIFKWECSEKSTAHGWTWEYQISQVI